MGNNISSIKLGSDIFEIRTFGYMSIEDGVITDGGTCPDFNLVPNTKVILYMDSDYMGFIDCIDINETGKFGLYLNGHKLEYVDFKSDGIYEFLYTDIGWDLLSYNLGQLNIKFSDLKTLCQNETLIPGMKYRIIDYNPVIPKNLIGNTKTYSNPEETHTSFDIIVTATSNKELSHDAEAAPSSWDSEAVEYYQSYGVDMSKWKIKYDINSNPSKYSWAGSLITHTDGVPMIFMSKTDPIIVYGKKLYRTNLPEYFMVQDTVESGLYSLMRFSGTLLVRSYISDANGNVDFGNGLVRLEPNSKCTLKGEPYVVNWTSFGTDNSTGVSVFVPESALYAAEHGICYTYDMFDYTVISEYFDVVPNPNDCGVIYYLEDEHGNSCPFDFKNIRIVHDNLHDLDGFAPVFSLYGKTTSLDHPNCYVSPVDATVHTINVTNCKIESYQKTDNFPFTNSPYYTIPTNQIILGPEHKCNNIYFGHNTYSNKITKEPNTTIISDTNIDDSYNLCNIYIGADSYENIVTHSNNKLGLGCYENLIDGSDNLLGNGCNNNTIDDSYSSILTGSNNSLGNGCHDNKISGGWNTLGEKCSSNIINGLYNVIGKYSTQNETSGAYNTIGISCGGNAITGTYNTIGNGCRDNVVHGHSNDFENACMHNDIGIASGNSSYNSFGAGCEYNILGNNSSYNTFGNSCSHNMIGHNCCNNSWGNSVSYTGFVSVPDVIPSSLTSCVNYCYNNRFDDGVSYIYLLSMSTASYTHLLMNYHIHRGCSFSQSNPLWLDSARGSIKTTHVYKGGNPDTIIL